MIITNHRAGYYVVESNKYQKIMENLNWISKHILLFYTLKYICFIPKLSHNIYLDFFWVENQHCCKTLAFEIYIYLKLLIIMSVSGDSQGRI